MTYSLKSSETIKLCNAPQMPSIPKLVMDSLPKGKRCEIHYDNGVWKIDGKVVKQDGSQ